MSRIDRYIFWQLLGVFGFFALVLVSVYWINRAVGLLDTVLGDGHSFGVFVQMSLLTIPGVIELIAPMAAFGAAAFTANKLMADSELVILQATGFSYVRIMRPVFYFSIVVIAMISIVNSFLIPAAATQLRELRSEMAQNSTAKYLKEGQFHRPNDHVVLYFREITDNGEILDIFIADGRSDAMTQVYTAQRALFVDDQNDPKLFMLDGVIQRKDTLSNVLSISRFADFTISLKSLVDQDDRSVRSITEFSTLALLTATPDLAKASGRRLSALLYEGHLRITWPLSTAFTGLIGFATLLLGTYNRKGLLKQLVLAVTLLIALYLVHIVTLSTGRVWDNGWILAYITPLFGLCTTFVVLWLAGRPRKLHHVKYSSVQAAPL